MKLTLKQKRGDTTFRFSGGKWLIEAPRGSGEVSEADVRKCVLKQFVRMGEGESDREIVLGVGMTTTFRWNDLADCLERHVGRAMHFMSPADAARLVEDYLVRMKAAGA